MRIVSICENCTSVVYHKRLNCTNNENCTSVGGASALFNSCFRRSAASKLWDPKEENPILSKINIYFYCRGDIFQQIQCSDLTFLSISLSFSPGWQLLLTTEQPITFFCQRSKIWKCFYSTNFNWHLNFLQFIWNFKNATLMSWKLFRVKWCNIKLTWFHPPKNQYSECW